MVGSSTLPAVRHGLHGILEPVAVDTHSHMLILFVSIRCAEQHIEIQVHDMRIEVGDIGLSMEHRHQAPFCIEGYEMIHPHADRIGKDVYCIALRD